MEGLLRLSRGIDAVSRVFGLIAAVTVLVVSLLVSADALVSYGLTPLDVMFRGLAGIGLDLTGLLDWYRAYANSVTDLSLLLFAAMVMLGGAWTLKVNEHVRVDLVFSAVGERGRVWIDLLGAIFFLLPTCIVMIWFTWPWFVEAWTTNEMSINAGGLPRWPVKLMLPIGYALMILQAFSEIIKCLAAMSIGYVREHAYEKPLQ